MADAYVDILSNVSRTLYVGCTSNMERRMFEHRKKVVEGFTRRYNLTMLAYFEGPGDLDAARAREKQIKGWTRAKKIALIESVNPDWRDFEQRLVQLSTPAARGNSGATTNWRPFACVLREVSPGG
jgi:putative endonuclease